MSGKNPTRRVLVTGAGGQLGTAIVQAFAASWDTIGLAHRELEIADARAVQRAVARHAPDCIVNCAAYTDVDGAEREPARALEINAFAVLALARAARAGGALLVHFSTDFVFDGLADTPYTEADRPNPRSAYAASKLMGEWFAEEAEPAYVLRVESLFGGPAVLHTARRSSLDRIVDHLAEGKPTRIFHDRTVSPSYAVDVASAVRTLVDRRAAPGLYHCVNTGAATWYDVALYVQGRLGAAAPLERVSTDEVRLPAARPKFSALSNAKIVAAGAVLPTWQDAVDRYLSARSSAARLSGFGVN
jgi:dTDP-4-dehydrorhamnose reductase